MLVGGLDKCQSLAHFHMQRNVAGGRAAIPFTVVTFHPVAVVSLPPLFWRVRRCEGKRDSSDWVCQLLARMAKLELLSLVFLNVVPSCSCVPLHCAWVWRSCLQALFRRPLDAPSA